MQFFESVGFFVETLGNFVSHIPKALGYLLEVMVYMPAQITLYMISAITCSIVLLVLGRN